MGFAGGIGGLLAILIGRTGDVWGLHTALIIIFLLPFAGGILGLFMKNRPAAQAMRTNNLLEN